MSKVRRIRFAVPGYNVFHAEITDEDTGEAPADLLFRGVTITMTPDGIPRGELTMFGRSGDGARHVICDVENISFTALFNESALLGPGEG